MTNAIQTFYNSNFGNIRTLNEEGKALFCGKDVAIALGFSKPFDAIARHCAHSMKRRVASKITNQHGTVEGETEMTFISEGDVIRLIVRSNLPAAEKFERWVFDEVIPSVLHNGSYALTPARLPDFTDPVIAARAWADEVEKKLCLEAQIKHNAPKVELAERLESSPGTILIGDLAKELKKNGLDIGRDRLFALLHSNGENFLMKSGENRHVPTQKALELGVLESHTRVIDFGNGTGRIAVTPRVTGKGVAYFIRRYCQTGKTA